MVETKLNIRAIHAFHCLYIFHDHSLNTCGDVCRKVVLDGYGNFAKMRAEISTTVLGWHATTAKRHIQIRKHGKVEGGLVKMRNEL